MADIYLKSGSGAIVYSNRAWSLGERMVPTLADATSNVNVARAWVWEVTTAGTSSATPAWPASATQDVTTVTEAGGVVWTARKPGYQSVDVPSWLFATIYMQYAALAMAAGDRLFVSNNHAELANAASQPIFPGTISDPNQVLCVDDAQTDPASMTLATTASVTVTAGSPIRLFGSFYCYGVLFAVSTTTGSPDVRLAASTTASNWQVFEKCKFALDSSVTGAHLLAGTSTGSFAHKVRWYDCEYKVGHADHFIRLGGDFEWRKGALTTGTAAMTALFEAGGLRGSALLTGIDLSLAGTSLALCKAAASGVTVHIVARGCKMPSGWTPTGWSGTPFIGQRVEWRNCSDGDHSYRLLIEDYAGKITEETTIVRTGGASDGATPISYKMVSSANAEYPFVLLESPEISVWNEATGGAKTLTVEIAQDNAAANLKDDEIWVEASALTTSGAPLRGFVNDAKANVLATAADQATSTEAWGGTTPTEQKLVSPSFTPQEKGQIRARVYLAKPSTTVYICPKPTVS